jgi:hypothetical protein
MRMTKMDSLKRSLCLMVQMLSCLECLMERIQRYVLGLPFPAVWARRGRQTPPDERTLRIGEWNRNQWRRLERRILPDCLIGYPRRTGSRRKSNLGGSRPAWELNPRDASFDEMTGKRNLAPSRAVALMAARLKLPRGLRCCLRTVFFSTCLKVRLRMLLENGPFGVPRMSV